MPIYRVKIVETLETIVVAVDKDDAVANAHEMSPTITSETEVVELQKEAQE